MGTMEYKTEIEQRVAEFVRTGFSPRFGERKGQFPSNPVWKRMRDLGTALWLDTGSIEEATAMYTEEFSALTTNNTLLNREVQKGTYDEVIKEATRLLDAFPKLSDRQRTLELAFILNARHGLRLVELFDAFVSVEEHTDLTNDMHNAIYYARRLHAICPERFIVKIPLSPAGILATRRVSAEGIPINHTLGFSARQNYVIARIGRPAFVNVFLGRLNSLVADNALGSGALVGEKATLATQTAVAKLRQEHSLTTRLIGASFRSGAQVRDLAGLDVMTIPPKVAQEFLELGLAPGDLEDRTSQRYEPPLVPEAAQAGLDSLWHIDDGLRACVDALEKEDVDRFSADQFVDFFEHHGCEDLFTRWTEAQIQTSAEEGKIPNLEHWRDELSQGRAGLDSLMNLAGWNSFRADQAAMDLRVKNVSQPNGKT